MFISADYPYINYYVINKSREEAGHFYTHNKLASHDGLNAAKLGYTLVHSMDLYDEVGDLTVCSLRCWGRLVAGCHNCSASSRPGPQETHDGLHRLHHLYLPGLQGRRRREVWAELALLDRWASLRLTTLSFVFQYLLCQGRECCTKTCPVMLDCDGWRCTSPPPAPTWTTSCWWSAATS